MNVTADQLFAANRAAKINYIPHHECSICGHMVHYSVANDGYLFFHSSCNCSFAQPRAVPWADAAAWINMQYDPEWSRKIALSFGLELKEEEEAQRTDQQLI